ncbi:MAG: nuclear transport factor 2 family protein [Thermoanaerobaculia bacterium]
MESDEIVTVTKRLFAAMRDRDEATMRLLIHPRAQIHSVRAESVGIRTREEFIASCIAAPDPVDERIGEPEVHVDGDIAALWAPYDVHLGARFSHDGFDSFQFVREDGAWRLVSAMYTVRPR